MTRFFRVNIPATSLALLLSDILLATSAFVLATYLTMDADPQTYLIDDGGLLRLMPVLLTIIVGMHFSDLYSRVHVQSPIVLLQQLCLVMGVAFLAQGFLSYLSPTQRASDRKSTRLNS